MSDRKEYPEMVMHTSMNQGYGRLQLAAAYHEVMHDISMSRFTEDEAKSWNMILGLLKKRRDNLHALGHREINTAIQK